jgi:hypothetical protein
VCSAPKRRWLVSLALVLPTMACGQENFELEGYYKSLLAVSETVLGSQSEYTVDINRLRLELRGRPVPWFDYELQYDNEALLGSYLRTEQFQLLQALPQRSYWDLEDEYLSRDSVQMSHRVYRAVVTATAAETKVSLGRQRIAWGSGRLWNPTDLLNPYNPTQLEFQEREGADAVLVEQSFGALSRASAVYAPQRAGPASRALRFGLNVSQTDLAVMAGQFHGSDVIGAEFAGRLGEAGFHGEAAYTRAEESRWFTRAVIGIDYAFPNTLTVGAELYWNGQGTSNSEDYDLAGLVAGEVQNVARRYVGGQARYEITPLLRCDTLLIWNMDDSSRYFAPQVVYSLKEDFDVSAGVQFFGGSKGSEYGYFKNVYHAGVQWFF